MKEFPPQMSFGRISDELENGFVYEHLPFSDLHRWIPENGLVEKAFRAFPLGRLDQIRALSFLSYVGPNPKDVYALEYTHTRLDHTLVVALTVEEILRRYQIPQEQVTIGVIAALLHDVATPAHGDATKAVDMENLHEEKFWWDVLDQEGKDFIKQNGTDRDTLDKIIKNEGVLGQVLDIADRITYTMKDLNAVMGQRPAEEFNIDPYLLTLRYILSHNLEIGNIYKDVAIDQRKQEVFFTNPKNLGTFLMLRAHLFQSLYMHPTSQGRDFLVSKLIKTLYSKNRDSDITPEKLRNMTDMDLRKILADHYKVYFYSELDVLPRLINWYPEYEKFDTQEKAETREKQLKIKKDLTIIGVKECQGFDPGTSYKVVEGNRYVKFRDYDPTVTGRIERIARETKGFFVFYVDASEDTPINRLIKAVVMPKRS